MLSAPREIGPDRATSLPIGESSNPSASEAARLQALAGAIPDPLKPKFQLRVWARSDAERILRAFSFAATGRQTVRSATIHPVPRSRRSKAFVAPYTTKTVRTIRRTRCQG
jgi:hypothetical protein